MNDMLKGMWRQIRGEAKSTWGEITDDEWMEMEGDFDKLTGKLQQKYGYNKEKAQSEVERFRMEMNRKYGKDYDKI